MKLSLNWIGRFVDIDDLTPAEVHDHLSMSTAEVEGIEEFGAGLDGLVVGHVVDHGRHPDADKLSLNRVDVGAGEPLSIVCGAPNIGPGQKVVVVQPGSTLPGGVKIKKTKIRGVESFGMICSERELGLSDDHEGIMVLDDDSTVGQRFVDIAPVRDAVLEVDNKSVNHRPDLWGHYGFARELAAILDRPLRPLELATDLPADGRALEIRIENAEDCPRFTGIVLTGVRAERSPDWMRYLLHAVGQRSMNLLVDLTNFVMLEVGQPMHAFDLRQLDASGILVRRARDGERMVTIDEGERKLEPGDLLVTSGDEPVALAGIMGGAASAVADDTTELFLESANFNPSLIRRTSTRLALRTDASARFEKSLDPAMAEQGSRRFIALLREHCPGVEAAGPLRDPAQWRYEPRSIDLRTARLDAKLGHVIDPVRVRSILEGLQFGVEPTDTGFRVAVPSFRATKDITIEDDLIEEVGRMFRYDNIPEQPLRSEVAVVARSPELYLGRELLRLAATELACNEVYNYSFVPEEVLRAAGAPEGDDDRYCTVANPVAPEIARMRRHVMPSLLATVAPNLRTRGEVRVVELGKGYHGEHRDDRGVPREVLEMALVWSRATGAHPYAELRTGVETMLERSGYPASLGEIASADPELPWNHPGKTVAVMRGDAGVGHVGSLHPSVCRAFGLPATTAIATLDVRALVASEHQVTSFRKIPRFPSQPVDVALVVPERVRVGEIEAFLRTTGKKLVRAVSLFEVYRGEGIPEGHKSLNFTVTLGAADRTLDASDEERFLSKVRQRAETVGAELRG